MIFKKNFRAFGCLAVALIGLIADLNSMHLIGIVLVAIGSGTIFFSLAVKG